MNIDRPQHKAHRGRTLAIVGFVLLACFIAGVVVWGARRQPHAFAPSTPVTPPSSPSETPELEPATLQDLTAHSSALGCAAGYDPLGTDIECEVALYGAGPANLYISYLLAPILGNKLCIIDDRAKVGGKVQSIEAPQSTPSNPLFACTHAEQLQSSHVRMRCLAQAMGVEAYIRLGWFRRPKHWEFIDAKGFNTSNICPDCWTWSAEKLMAPNGIPSSRARYPLKDEGEPNGLPNLCGSKDYTECSYGDELWLRLIDTTNKNELQAESFEIFSDYARHRLGSPEAANQFFGAASGIGYIVTPRDTPTGAVAGREYADEEWNGPSVGFYWPRGGPQQIWLKVAAFATSKGARFFMNERAECLDKATDSAAGTYPYVVRTNKRNVRSKRVVMGMPAGQFVDTIKGTWGSSLAKTQHVKAVSSRFPQCSIELWFPNQWWANTRTQPTDGFYFPNGSFGIIDTPAIRNITEWTFYDSVNGNWFRWMPHPEIREMNLIRFLPDVCEEWNEVYLNGNVTAIQRRAMRIMRQLFEPKLTVSEPLKVYFSYERYGFGHFNGQTNLSTTDVRNFAKQPSGSDRIGFSSESFQWQKAGWQEGAVEGGLALFDAPALSGYVSAAQIKSLDKCSNSKGATLNLATPSISDICMKLDNEVSMMESAGIDYCKRSNVADIDGSSATGPVRKERLGQ